MVMRKALPWLVLLLALPAAHGRDEPKKDDKPPPTAAKGQYDTLAKEYTEQTKTVLADARKAKGAEREKLYDKYDALGKEYTGKFLKLAEDNPKDAVAADAVFWGLRNVQGGDPKAEAKAVALIADLSPADVKRLVPFNGSRSAALLDAVLTRSEKAADDPLAGDLVGWVAGSRMFFGKGKVPASVATATDRLLEKFPNHPAVEQIVQTMARGGADDAATLKKIAATATSAKLKASATYGLGQNLAAQLDALGDKPEQIEKVAAEAEKVFAQAIELFDKEKLLAQKETAEKELTSFRTLRVGKEAPDIKGADLDGKEFKLTDYRGKVVLLDFWGNW